MTPPRKPDCVKRFEGETRPSRLRPAVAGGGIMPPPEPTAMVGSSPIASEIWSRLAPPLEQAGVLTVLDEPLFGGLCTTLAFVAEAHALLLEDGVVIDQAVGNGGRRVAKHPAAQVYRDMMGLAQRLAREFGLTFSARA